MRTSTPAGPPSPTRNDHWRAGCGETCKPCSGRDRRKRTRPRAPRRRSTSLCESRGGRFPPATHLGPAARQTAQATPSALRSTHLGRARLLRPTRHGFEECPADRAPLPGRRLTPRTLEWDEEDVETRPHKVDGRERERIRAHVA